MVVRAASRAGIAGKKQSAPLMAPSATSRALVCQTVVSKVNASRRRLLSGSVVPRTPLVSRTVGKLAECLRQKIWRFDVLSVAHSIQLDDTAVPQRPRIDVDAALWHNEVLVTPNQQDWRLADSIEQVWQGGVERERLPIQPGTLGTALLEVLKQLGGWAAGETWRAHRGRHGGGPTQPAGHWRSALVRDLADNDRAFPIDGWGSRNDLRHEALSDAVKQNPLPRCRPKILIRALAAQPIGGRLVLHDKLGLMPVTVIGFDVQAVEAWLHTVTEVDPPLSWTRLPGGHSNLTYLVTDSAGRELVLRRPPKGELLPKAHDMWREYRIIDALWPTAVPVAQPIAFCDDRAVADTHFYVMGKASGRVLHTGTAAVAWLDVPARARAGEAFINALAALHSLDPETLGLQDLGRPDSYVARQLSAWHRSWTTQVDSARHDDPRIHELHELLTARMPQQGSARIVHGDYGPHNTLFNQRGDVTAVLDWELATLGDPLADLGYCINSWVEPGEIGAYGTDPATARPGFPSRQDLIARYESATGADLGQLAYYRAFNWWKLACIIHGVYARYMEGKKSTEGVDLPDLFRRMRACVDAAEQQAALI